MRTLRGSRGWLLLALLASGAVTGCGGGVSGIGTNRDGGPGNPGDDLVGDDEIIVEDGGSPVDPRCASGNPIGTGQACPAAGLTCPLGTISDCSGGQRTLECRCDGSSWSCDPVTSPDCPPPITCPDPSTLYPGIPCATPLGQQCVSTDIPSDSCGGELPPPTKGVCTCTTGGWSCPQTHLPCVASPPACPNPYDVYAGGYCPAPGLDCPGNPQTCGAQLFYDALECDGTFWYSLAATACDIDGGAFDAMPAEAGVIFEND